jgi:hypothetical protein
VPVPHLDHMTINTFKGVNLTDPSHVIDDREFQSIENLIVNDTGDLIRRRPLRWFTEPSDQTGCYPIAIWYNRVVYFHPATKTLYLSQVNTVVTGSWKTQVLNQVVNNLGVISNGIMYFFSSAAASLIKVAVSDWTIDAPVLTETDFTIPHIQGATVAVMFKDRLFVTKGSSTQSSDIYFSEIGDPTNIPVANLLKVSPGDGDYITCMIPFGERLFIFKKYSTWVLITASNPTAWVVKLFDNQIGAISENCVVEKRGLLYVLAPRGLYRSDGVIYDYVGYPVEARFRDNIATLSTGSISLVDDYLFIQTNITSIGFWMFNPVQNAWSEQKFPTLNLAYPLTVGRQGYLRDGRRRTWFGMRDVVWFDLTDPDYPTNNQWSDYTLHNTVVGSRVITPIRTSFISKMWDNGAFYRSKRHKLSTMEITVPTAPSVGTAEFHTCYKFDRALTSDRHEFLVDPQHYGNMAHKIPGAGYNRRLQLLFDTDAVVDYTITGFDLTYFNKRDISENPE